MLPSIRWRIAIAYVILILVMLFGLAMYLLELTDQYTLESDRVSLTSQARLVSQVAASDFTNGAPTTDFDAQAKKLGSATGLRITIIALDGSVLGDSQADPASMENHSSRPEFVDAVASGLGSSVRTSPTQGERQLYVAVPIEEEGRTVGVARVSLTVSAIEATEQGIRNGVIAAGGLASVLAIVIALIVVRQLTQPIRELTRLAGDLSRGNFDGRIAVSSGDEIGELATAFNQMSTRLHELLRSLSHEKAHLEAILDNMADGIVITDEQGRVEMGNRAASRILHWPVDDLAGRSFVPVARDHELAEGLRECLETGVSQHRVVELGPQRWTIRALFTRVADSEANAGLVVLQDITDIRRTEATRRDFVANVSHELRTPLASIKLLVETLQAGAIDDREAAERFLDKMNVEVDNLTQLVRELLELSRIESGQTPLKVVETDVESLLRPAVERLRAQADRAGLRLDVAVAAGLPPVLADPDRVGQVIGNLVHNAIKFTPDGGCIAISAYLTDAATVSIEVRDNGVGIAAEDLPRIFERFYKADKARSGGGTGLGLAIAKHIVQAHGGTISAASVEGRGATFTFTLPAVNKSLTAANTTFTSNPLL